MIILALCFIVLLFGIHAYPALKRYTVHKRERCFLYDKHKRDKNLLRELKNKVKMDIKKICSLSILISFLLSQSTFPLSRKYVIECKHEYDDLNKSFNHLIVVNKREVCCWCGRKPVFVFMAYGHLEVFCLEHARDLFVSENERDEI